MSPTMRFIILSVLASCVAVSNCIVHRPPADKIPIGAEWLNNMPRGNEFNPPDTTQPVKEVNYYRCKLPSNVQEDVVHYLYAEVRQSNLGKGTNTDPAIRDWVNRIGQRGDDAGHIIGKNQGGLGTVHWNIFPQSRNFNRGVYADFEKVVNDAVRRNGMASLWYRFVYEDPQYPCRPTEFDYYLLSASFILSDGLLNPHNNRRLTATG